MQRAVTLEQLARLCQRVDSLPASIQATGWDELDAVLPGGGWRSGTLVELLLTGTGLGELRLLMPLLARMTQTSRHAALIAPPYIPFAPALIQHGVRLEHLLIVHPQRAVDTLWACEQTLRCNSFGAVLAWPAHAHDREIRRLQLAAEAGRSLGFLYRPSECAAHPSPAAVRLRLNAYEHGALHIDVLKCRGTRAGISLTIQWNSTAERRSASYEITSSQSLSASR